jgi:hypothetical protein
MKTTVTYSKENESPTVVLHLEQLSMNGPVISLSFESVANCSDASSLEVASMVRSQYT